VTPEAYLARVRVLLPALRERAPYAEELRRLPDETFDDFQEARLFRCIQPKRYGGYELDPEIFYLAIIEVGTVCGSSGWILGVIGVHNWHMALFPPQAQEDVWGKDTSIQISTSLAPTGTVERVDDAFRIRGHWSFSSGCDYWPHSAVSCRRSKTARRPMRAVGLRTACRPARHAELSAFRGHRGQFDRLRCQPRNPARLGQVRCSLQDGMWNGARLLPGGRGGYPISPTHYQRQLRRVLRCQYRPVVPGLAAGDRPGVGAYRTITSA
jgi:hypothetical protein